MSKRGRPRKRQSLFSVKDYIEYTSDSASDTNNINQNAPYELKRRYIQTKPNSENVQEEDGEQVQEEDGEQVQEEDGEQVQEEDGKNVQEEDGENVQEEDGEQIQEVQDEDGEQVQEVEEELLQQNHHKQHREIVRQAIKARQQQQTRHAIHARSPQQPPNSPQLNGLVQEQEEMPQPIADLNVAQVIDDIQEEQDDVDSDNSLVQNDQDQDYDSLFKELKSRWILTENTHFVSKSGSEAFWKLGLEFFTKLTNAHGKRKKTPMFKTIRRQIYNDLPAIDLKIAYKNRTSGEVVIVNDTVTPIKRFPPSKFDKLYEVATIQVCTADIFFFQNFIKLQVLKLKKNRRVKTLKIYFAFFFRSTKSQESMETIPRFISMGRKERLC